jgi:periplasmic protein TonB
MAVPDSEAADVFTVRDVARASGVPADRVRTLLRAGEVPSASGNYVDFESATRLVLLLKASGPAAAESRRLFTPPLTTVDRRGLPLLASGGLHALLLGAILLLASFGSEAKRVEQTPPQTPRLIFLSLPGPGGGGGGGGLRQPAPASRAELKGRKPLKSPVALAPRSETRQPDPPRPAPPPPVATAKVEPEPAPATAPVPPVVAPVASAPADARDRAGVVDAPASEAASSGPGTGGGTGNGMGPGSGRGNGTGIGDGSIAGTGGGPYKPGSGVTPPTLVREVKPVYTDDARRAGIEGDVLLDVVIRADGRVGAVTVTRSLGGGLDQRAIEAVRQWTFLPSRRNGAPVDVLVEVAVEFRLR